MHVLSLQALDKRNRIGLFREIYRRWMMKYSWPKADLVFVNSQWTASQALAFCPKLHNRIVISYEGLQHEIFNTIVAPDEQQQLKEKFGILPRYLLWVSNFYPYKQPEQLIAGYSRLDPEIRRLHPLVMAGGDWLGGLAAAKAQVKFLGVGRDVKFLGWIDDCWLAPLYRHAAAFCLASREETFGRCVIEAMACGTPCIVSDIPTMREITASHALLVNFHDTEAVGSALKKILIDPAFAAKLRAEGLIRAREFTFEKLATERIMAIQRLVSSDSKYPSL
jgi:glycosyltransferase involved in cell wall biosynthesis